MDFSELQATITAHLLELWDRFQTIPGSAIIIRYVKSSYQDDPIRTAFEAVLLLFAIHYVLAPKYSTKPGFVELTDKEIDDLVEDWTPEPLVTRAPPSDEQDVEKRVTLVGPTGPKSKLSNGRTVINLASYNFYNFVANEQLKEKAIHTLRNYGVGPCGPPGFYGTQDVHMRTEADVAAFLGVPACIIYAQAFSTASSVIPAFSKRGDIIVADRACNYSLRKGIQISRSIVRWYDHNDMEDLERVLARVTEEQKGKPLTRRFIVTEGLFDSHGDMSDLPTLIELRLKYKFRLILDETWSFGVLGRNGRGLTEHQNVDPTQVDMIIGSLSGPLIAGGGFCAGSEEIVHHQRISALAYCFSAALPGLLATTATETLALLQRSPELIAKLRENIKAMRSQLDPRSEFVHCTSVAENPIIICPIKPEIVEAKSLSLEDQTNIIRAIVDECLLNNVLITRVQAIRDMDPAKGAEEVTPALKICMTTGLTKKEVEKAGTLIRHAITKVFRARR
ncbi:serine palmitoyltransferase component [Ascosphaera acerosa]|nr:serine palmitoyltransferase component [Ascosphaera acerosa]